MPEIKGYHLAIPNRAFFETVSAATNRVSGDERGAFSAVLTAMICNDFCFQWQLDKVKSHLPDIADELECPGRSTSMPPQGDLFKSIDNPVFNQ